MSNFDHRDPTASPFWDERFSRNFMPWDQGNVPQALRAIVAAATRPYATFIPGCGAGHEVRFLSEAGWPVAAIDFSPVAVHAAKANLGQWADRVGVADFFSYMPPERPQLIYERAFLCALPRGQWPLIVARWAQLLQKGGLVAGFFYFDDAPKGPPFGANSRELSALLQAHFAMIDDRPVEDSIPIFAGKERWQVWQRLG